jgi:thiol-disulfide isomerase/thioredoxin
LHVVRDQPDLRDQPDISEISGAIEGEAGEHGSGRSTSGERDSERSISEVDEVRERAVTPDTREEPGVVESDGGVDGERLGPAMLAGLGVGPAAATLLQFSSAFCAPCRAVRRVSSEVAALLPGVQHVEVDAESHLDEVRALGIWRTPTLLLLDAGGRVVKRATGVPSKPQLIAALGEILPAAD